MADSCCTASLSGFGLAAEFTSFQDGVWFDDPDLPNDGAFLGVPGTDDIANVIPTVSIRPQADRGVEMGDMVGVNVLNMLPGGTLNMLNQIKLAVDGNSAGGGGTYTRFLNGGGLIHDQGVVTVTGQVLWNRGQLLNTEDLDACSPMRNFALSCAAHRSIYIASSSVSPAAGCNQANAP